MKNFYDILDDRKKLQEDVRKKMDELLNSFEEIKKNLEKTK